MSAGRGGANSTPGTGVSNAAKSEGDPFWKYDD
jgi:hypothetical protein